MWLLSFIPDSVMYSFIMMLIFIGAVGFLIGSFGNLFSFTRTYSTLIKTVSIVLLLGGIYGYGGYGVEIEWRKRAAELQAEIDRKDAESVQVTEKIVTQYKEKIKVVKERGDVIIEKVPEYITVKSDDQCVIPKSFVLLHDSASKNEVPNTTGPIDDSTSAFKLSDVARTVTINYSSYHQLSEQLKALQDWIKQQEKIYNGN